MFTDDFGRQGSRAVDDSPFIQSLPSVYIRAIRGFKTPAHAEHNRPMQIPPFYHWLFSPNLKTEP